MWLNNASIWATCGALLLWYMYCTVDGAVDGIYHDKPPSKSTKKLPFHAYKATLRLCMLIPLFAMFGVVFVIGLCLVYPLLHNGTQYQVRNHLNEEKYPDRFWAEPSRTGDERMSFSKRSRVLMSVIGGIVLVVATLAAQWTI